MTFDDLIIEWYRVEPHYASVGKSIGELDVRQNSGATVEVFGLVVFGSLFLVAGFSETIHVAEAIGALLVRLVLAETEHAKRIEHLIVPFRDFFGALFFFCFGLSIDPLSLGGNAICLLLQRSSLR
jgi:Kef-type K+ transport system membrane component KefB